MKGYLCVKPASEIEREFRQMLRQNHDESALLRIRSSLEGMGWIPLAAAIKHGNFLKVSAEKHDPRYEARFNLSTNAPKGDHGTCEIRGGPLACVGIFVSVSTQAP